MREAARRERRVNTIIFVCVIALIPLALWSAWRFTLEAGEAALQTAVDRPDCGEFEFDHEVWVDGDPDERAEQASGIRNCGSFDGFRRDSIEVLLGEPTEIRPNGHTLVWEIPQQDGGDLGPRELSITFKDGVVRSTGFFQPTFYGGLPAD